MGAARKSTRHSEIRRSHRSVDARSDSHSAHQRDSPQEVRLVFRSVGFFPNANRPRVIWGGMQPSENLAPLAHAIDQQIGTLGFPAEERAFTPHLTLARLDPPGIAPELRGAIEKHATRDFGVLHASEFHLIESKLKPSGAEYTTLQTFPFVSKD